MQPQDVSATLRNALVARCDAENVQLRQSRFFAGADYWALDRRLDDGSAVTVTVTNLYDERTLAVAFQVNLKGGADVNSRHYASWPYNLAGAENAVSSCLAAIETWLYRSSLVPARR